MGNGSHAQSVLVGKVEAGLHARFEIEKAERSGFDSYIYRQEALKLLEGFNSCAGLQ